MGQMSRLTRQYSTDPMIYGTARHIVASVPEKAWRREVDALFYFVRDTIRYTLDPHECEGLQTPVDTLLFKAGDCDDKAMLLGALLISIGYPVEFVAVQVDNAPHYSHVFPRTLVNNAWVNLETTERWASGVISNRITGNPLILRVE